MTIYEMNCVIQRYCADSDCLECAINHICNSVMGDFKCNPAECTAAYEIIKDLAETNEDTVNHPKHFEDVKKAVWYLQKFLEMEGALDE